MRFTQDLKQNIPASLFWPGFLKAFFIGILLAIGFIMLLYYEQMSVEKAVLHELESRRVRQQADLITFEFQSIVADLRFLSNLNELTDPEFNQLSPAILEKIRNEFTIFAANKPAYKRISIYNMAGEQILQVYRNADSTLISEQIRLNPIFDDIDQLPRESVFVSPFSVQLKSRDTASIGHNLISFGIPIFLPEENGVRVIILDYDQSRLIQNWHNEPIIGAGHPILIQPNGYWLMSPQVTDAWGFALVEAGNRRFAIEHPRAWQRIKAELSGQFSTPNGLFTFITVHPLIGFPGAEVYTREAMMSDERITRSVPFEWKIISQMTPAMQSARLMPFYWLLVEVLLGFVLLAGVGAFLFARATSHRFQAEMKARQQSEFLENILESLAHPFYVLDTKTHEIKVANRAALEQKVGIKRHCYEISHHRNKPCDGSEHPCPISEVMQTGKPVVVEHIHYNAKGETRNVEVHGFPIFAENGDIQQMIEYVLDITERNQAREAMEESLALLRATLESTADGILVVSLAGNIISYNHQFEKMWQMPPGWTQISTREDRFDILLKQVQNPAKFSENVQTLYAHESRESYDQIHLKDGRVFEHYATPYRVGGEILGRVWSFRDISERIQAERTIREKDVRLHALLGSLDDIVFEVDADGTYLNVWTARKDLLILPREDLLGKNIREVMGKETGEILYKMNRRVLETGNADNIEYSIERNGRERWFHAHINPIPGPDGAYQSVSIVARDITQRKANEIQLRKLSQAIELSPATIVITDAKGNIEYVNPKFTEVTGYTLAEVLGKNPRVLKSGYTPSDGYKELWETITAGQEWTGEFHNVKKSGEYFWELASISPITNEAGEITHFLAIKEDITDRKEAEAELKKLSGVVEQTADHVMITDQDGHIQYVNPAFERFTGFMLSDIRNQKPNILKSGQHSTDFYKEIWQTITAGDIYRGVLINKCKDGRIYYEEKTISPLRNEAGEITHFVSTGKDITQRNQMQKELVQREKKFSTIFNSATDAIFIHDLQGNFLEVNEIACQRLGYSRDELLQMTPADIDMPETRDQIAPRLDRLRVEGHVTFETAHVHRDGHVIPVEISASVIEFDNQQAVLSLVRDITERKQTRKALEQAKHAAESANRAKSEFLANMSHELRTPLNGILGYAQILKQSDGLNSFQLEGLSIIEHSGSHLLNLINQILDLSKIEARKMEIKTVPTDITDVLSTLAAMIKVRAHQKGIRFDFEMTALPELVAVDEKRLTQVLLNLLSNAIKFTEQGGVTCRVKYAGQRLFFEVRDTGIGIAADEIQAIFSPFRQIGDQARNMEGTGLGLTISRRLVKLMGSDIQVESKVGFGSRFWFDIPAPETLRKKESVEKAGSRIIGYAGPRRKILIVDDKAHNRHILEHLLAPLDFETVQAENGQEALDLALKSRPDLILLDIVMPGLSGLEVAQRIRKHRELKKMKIIAITANSFDKTRQECEQAGFDDFLPKPFEFKVLYDMIQTQLNLEWMYQKPSQEETSFKDLSVIDATTPVPPQAILKELYNAVRIGDVLSVRQILAKIDDPDDRFADFINHMRTLLTSFRMKQLEEILVRLLNR